jgi:tRNA-2-methylthio-N6-dimethylallyladenosine synthase
MRRRHTREEYLRLLDRLREAVPAITVSTDVIVGFPGESAQDFDDTLTLTEQAQYLSMFSFKYSPRPNTLASKRMPDDVTEAEKTARIVRLQALQKEIQTTLHERMVGTVAAVLVDSISRRGAGELSGRSASNTVVSFPVPPSPAVPMESWVGTTVDVRILRAGPHSVSGTAANAMSQESSC